MGFYLPKTLEKFNNWVLWKLEDGQKKPYSAKYNGLASVAKPYQWADYGTAVCKLENTGEYNGLGFVFSRHCGLVFIDLDHCMNEDGEPNEFASGIIELFSGSYMEYSQSGTGLHIVCRGTIPAAYKGAQIELYNCFRYMAFTGNAYEANEPQPAQAALDTLCKRFAITEKQAPALSNSEATAEDQEVIQRAQRGRNGAAFMRLYAGEWQNKYKSHSEADMRLIALLWYYSRNAEQVERLFLSSGLADRKKAGQHDYIQRTIAKAAQNTPAAQQHTADRQDGGKYRKRAYWK